MIWGSFRMAASRYNYLLAVKRSRYYSNAAAGGDITSLPSSHQSLIHRQAERNHTQSDLQLEYKSDFHEKEETLFKRREK